MFRAEVRLFCLQQGVAVMLTESEWNEINTMILDLYTLNDVEIIAKKTLGVLRQLVPFSTGYFLRLDENHKTSIYQDSAASENADFPYFIEVSVKIGEQVIGIFNLFREASLENFSEKDLYILSILKKHLENMMRNSLRLSELQDGADKCFSRAVSAFSLSDREADVLRLIADGRSNGDISEQIHVSVSTVKKHVYNIFNKAGVNSRTQLLNMVYSIH